MRRQRARQRVAEPTRGQIHDAHSVSVYRSHGREHAHLAQAQAGAKWKIEASGVGPIDDAEVVIARQQQGPPCQLRMPGKRRKELGPFRRPPGIGDVACYEDKVERLPGMDGVEPGQYTCQPFVAARAGPSALDAEAVALADHVQVRQVRDAPSSAARLRPVECRKIAWLIHQRVGEPPDEGRRRQIPAQEHHGIGQRRHDKPVRCGQVRDPADPPRGRPREQHYAQGGSRKE